MHSILYTGPASGLKRGFNSMTVFILMLPHHWETPTLRYRPRMLGTLPDTMPSQTATTCVNHGTICCCYGISYASPAIQLSLSTCTLSRASREKRCIRFVFFNRTTGLERAIRSIVLSSRVVFFLKYGEPSSRFHNAPVALNCCSSESEA